MKEPEIILESWSPCCDIQAFVEESEDCYYFYLWFHPGKENAYIKSCWIANRSTAPKEFNKDMMDEGMAPMLPYKWITHDRNGICLNSKELRIEWYEEGDAAALIEKDDILCIIPSWGGMKDFCGYAKYAVGMTPFAWELTGAKETMCRRLEKSREFWNELEGDFWPEIQQMHMQALEGFFGAYEKYYAIDGGYFPPKALITGRKNNICYGITAGVSLLPMPTVELYYQEGANDFRRIELGFAANCQWQEECNKMYSFLSSLSALPWREISFLGHGHTIPCDVIENYSAVWLLDARIVDALEAPNYPEFRGEKVNLLWVVPVKQELWERIIEVGTDEVLSQMDVAQIHIFKGL